MSNGDDGSGTPLGNSDFPKTRTQLAEMRTLERLCHPSSRIASHLVKVMGLTDWPQPALRPAPRFAVEAAWILPEEVRP